MHITTTQRAIAVIVALAVIGGAIAAALWSPRTAAPKATTSVSSRTSTTTPTTVPVASSSGSYVTLATYTASPEQYNATKRVYFFHAPWCSICQSIDKAITASDASLPAGVTMIKTDFDTSSELRQKYGVTNQYTFVQVDASGNEVAQWSATSLATAIAGIR